MGSLTKEYKVYTMVFTIISTYDTSTNLDPTKNMKLLNANYAPKAPISTLYILERKKWMNS